MSNPASPVLRGSIGTGDQPYDVAVRGTTAFVVNRLGSTLQAFGVANPASPVLLGSAGTGSFPRGVAVSGTTAYVVNLSGNTLQAFNVANPANPVLLGSVGTGNGPIGVAVRGTTVYVVNNISNTLQAFSFPLPPRAVAVQADGSLTSVALPSATDFIQNGPAPQAANFNVSGAGTVGGRLAAGSARIGNLTTAGIVTTDASGNLGSSTGSGSFIQNGTAPQAGSNFNVSGAGTVGGLLTAGSAAVTGNFNVSGAGTVGGLLAAGSARIGNLTTAGIVTTNASGNLGSSTATAAFGTSFIQNTTAPQAGSNFNVSGAGTVGGLLTAGSASVAGDVLAGANVVVDAGSANAGTLAGTLRLGGSGSGEALGSKRTAGGNQYGLDFYTNSASRLSIGLNGNVGIGTAAPVQLLDVSGTPAAAAAGTLPLLRLSRPQASGVRFANAFEINLGAFGTTSDATTQVDFRLSNGQTDTPDMTALTLRSDGNVGIGTTSPAFPLDVQTTVTPANYAYAFYAYNPGVRTGTATSTGAVSIRASGRVVAAEFKAVSDRRLKTVVGRSDTGADLALLNRLRITDYTMRDRVQFGNRAFKKVIAQEVEAVFPQAVRQHTGFLPDVYALATAVAALPGDSLVALTLPAPGLPVAAAAGRRLQLIGAGGEVPAALARPAAAGARTLVLRRAQALAGAGGPVFVFGLEHADVRAVDYEALGMLNVSATQELARQVRALQQQNAALQARTAALETQTAADHASLQTVQQQLARLLSEGAPAAAQARR